MTLSRLSWKSLSAIVVLPPLAVSAYIAFPYYQASQQETPLPELSYTQLDFPSITTNKLPIRAQELALQRSSQSDKTDADAITVIPSNTSVTQPQSNRAEVKKQIEDTASSLDINKLDLSGLSPELAARFESVLNDPSEYEDHEAIEDEPLESNGYLELDKNGSQLSGRLPPLNFQTHNYTSKPSRRWVKVNGQEVNIGGSITPSITLLEINPRDVVIEFKGQKIEVPALYEWKG
ncbi:general secretion pathway protein GspB [Aliivibrio finisterrensis]|uniref:general secretion pathway protein GspB n=1 Tax=Aliivibrio finisterrensis TaxID=511998 RepID=UPI0010212D2C|nr:general secretion pathway protein GspB [Aliivibrio finisterrensis]RYU69988.1 general secretion pathway protein GspB [Aliivibrio finisterrensis]RYU73777.1 general secretion pathway protein GspB [Aliivibrio finisterrensis]RYU76621.1 general secretion pathway protein GspB [Aliivibrio finisterrensis]